MDPNSGKLYASLAEAEAAGVKNAVEVIGATEDVETGVGSGASAPQAEAQGAEEGTPCEPSLNREKGTGARRDRND